MIHSDDEVPGQMSGALAILMLKIWMIGKKVESRLTKD